MFTLPLRGRTDYLTDRYSELNKRASKDVVRHTEKLQVPLTI
jgi:hypothetical protein